MGQLFADFDGGEKGGQDAYLEEQAKGHAVCKGLVVEKGVQEVRTARSGEVVAQAAVEGLGE